MESNLSLPNKELDAEIGRYLGWGKGAEYDEKAWTAKQQNEIESLRKSGLRQFYFPPPIGGISYSWSFLRPTAFLTFPADASSMALPDDFGGIEGKITMVGSSENILGEIAVYGEGKVIQAHNLYPDATGRPEMASIRPNRTIAPGKGQRYELHLYPTTDAEYTLALQYYLLPNALKGGSDYAYGGAAHVETIMESCLAAAEKRLDDKEGVHKAAFMERLAASINHDRRLKQEAFGYNGDNSDERFSGRFRRRINFWMDRQVTLGGLDP